MDIGNCRDGDAADKSVANFNGDEQMYGLFKVGRNEEKNQDR